MAVTKEQLAISIEVDTGGFKAWSKEIDDGFKKISDSAESSSINLEAMATTAEFVRDNFDKIVKSAKAIFEVGTAAKAFTDTLIQVGNAVEWVGEKYLQALGDEKSLQRIIGSISAGLTNLSAVFYKYSTAILNFSTQIKLYTYYLSRMGDPAIVRMFYQSVLLITPVLDGLSEAINLAGISIARFGVFIRGFSGVVDDVSKKIAYFVFSTSKSMNSFGKILYTTGLDLFNFASAYFKAFNQIRSNKIVDLLMLLSRAVNPFHKYIGEAIKVLFAFGVAIGATAVSFIGFGVALGKMSLHFLGTIDIISKIRLSFMNTFESIGKSFINAGLSVQRFGIDIGNLSGRLKVFSQSFKDKDSTIMQVFAKGLGMAAPLVQKVSSYLEDFSKNTAVAGQFVKGLLPFVGEMSKDFQFAGIVTKLFGKTLTGFGNDAKNIVSILTQVGSTQVPFVGGMNTISNSLINASAGFASLGIALVQADSATAKFAGGAALALAAALGGFIQVTKAATTAIGDFVSGVGVKLFTLFDAGIQLAAEDEEATNRFVRSITRLSSSFEDGQKNIELWNSSLKEIQERSSVTESGAQAFAVAIAKIGQELNLTTDQQIRLAKNVSSFAINQEELVKATDAVRMALLGQARQAEELGIHLNDNAINSSDYANKIGKTVDAMTNQEKIQARLIAINSQASKAQSSLSQTGESLIEVSNRIKVSQEEISSAFAKSSIPIYKFFTSVQLDLLKAVEAISQPVKNAIANVVSYTGAVLIVIGATVKWAFTIGVTATAIAQLNTLIKVSAGLQSLLTLAFTVTNTAVNQQVVAITGLTSVIANLANLTKGLAVASLAALWRGLLAVGKAIAAVTMAVLSNPLFWKVTATVTAIAAVIKAISNLSEKSLFLQRIFAKTSTDVEKSADGLKKSVSIWERFGSILEGLFDKVVALAEIMIGGLLAAVNATAIGFVKLKAIFADGEDVEAYDLMLQEMQGELFDTGKHLQNATDRLLDFGGKAYAATDPAGAISNGIEEIGNTSLVTASKLEQMTERIMKTFDAQRERLKILGDDYDRANVRILEARDALAKANAMPQDNGEKAKSIAESRIDLIKAEIESEKVRSDLVTKMLEEQNRLKLDDLKLSGKKIQAIKVEYSQKIAAIKAEEDGLKKLGGLRLDEQITINQTLKAVKAAQAAEINAARIESLKKVRDLEEHVNKIKLEGAKASQDQILAISAKNDQLKDELEKQYKIAAAGENQKKIADELLKSGYQALELLKKEETARFDNARTQELTGQVRELEKAYREVNQTAFQAIQSEKQARLDNIDATQRKMELDGRLLDSQKQQLSVQREITGLISEKQIRALYRANMLFGEQLQSLREYFSIMTDLVGMSVGSIFDSFKKILSDIVDTADKIIEKGKEGKDGKQSGSEGDKKDKQAASSWFGEMFGKAQEYATDAVSSISSGISDMIPQGVMDAGAEIASAAGEMGNIFMMITSIIMKAPAIILSAVDGISQAVEGLLNFPEAIVNALTRLDQLLTKFIQNFPQAIQTAMQKVPAILVSIAEKIPDFLINLMEELPNIAEKLAEVIPAILARLIDKLPALAASFAKAMWNMTVGMIRGFFNGLTNIWKGGEMPKLVDTDKTIEDIKKGVGKLTEVTDKIFNVGDITEVAKKQDAGKNIAKAIEESTYKASNWLSNAWKNLIKGIREAWLWIYDRVIMPLINGLRDVWLFIYNRIIQPLINGIRTVWLFVYDRVILPLVNGIREVWLWVYESVVLPIVNGIRAVWTEVYENILLPVIELFKGIWTAFYDQVITPIVKLFTDLATNTTQAFTSVFTFISDGLKAVFDAGKAIFDGIWNAGKALFDGAVTIFKGIWDGAKAIFDGASKIFSDAWAGFKNAFAGVADIGKNIVNSITEGIKSIGNAITGIFSGIANTFKSIFKFDMEGIKNGITEAFTKAGNLVKSAFGAVINPLIDIFNGLIDALNGLKIDEIGWSISAGRLGSWSGTLIPAIDLIPGDIGKIAKFAQGGLVSGPGGVDNVPAMLSNGEFVMNRKAVSGIGLPALTAMNQGKAIGGATTNNVTVNLKIEAKEKIDEAFVKQRLMPAIREELKRNSLDGRAIVYGSGVRS